MTNQQFTLAEAIYDYREARAGRYAASTWAAHERQIERFRDWAVSPTVLGANCLLIDVNERTMVQYFNRHRGVLAPSSFNNYRQYLRMFFRFCREEGWIPRDPMRHVDPLTVVKGVRLQLSADELLACLEGAEPRDRVALAVGMNTALRGGDIAALKVGDVNLTNDTLTAFISKTQEYVQLPITAELRAELLRWFECYAENQEVASVAALPNHWWLVPGSRYRAVKVTVKSAGGRNIYLPDSPQPYLHPEVIVQRALARLGHPTSKEGFHTLRRSALRVLFDLAAAEGVPDPIRIPQSLAGHKNRATTEIYLGVTHEKRVRDDLLRGKSFLGRAAVAESAESATVAAGPGVPRGEMSA